MSVDYQDDLNALLNGAVDVATDVLTEQSEFSPFALLVRTSDGEVIHVEPEAEELDETDDVMTVLELGLREAALSGEFRALALVSDVALEGPAGESMGPAIHVALEHVEKQAMICVVPYVVDAVNVEVDEVTVEEAKPKYFPAADQMLN